MSAKLPTEPIIIGEFEKNSKDTVRVTLQQFHEQDLLGIRVFYKDNEGNLKPGKDGLSIRVDQFSKLAAILAEAGARLKAEGLL